jgi:phosphinothricin acetyltransferase
MTQIRLATRDDAHHIQAIYAPIVQSTHISFEQVVPDVAEIERRIDATLAQYPYLVCDINGQVAGYCYASSFRSRAAYQWTTETTVYMHPAYHSRGIAKMLYTTLLNVLRGQGYMNAVSVIALPNEASVQFHEALGFKKIGVFENMGYKAGNWRDTGWWQCELRPMPSNPSPPTPITTYCQTSDFAAMLDNAKP